MARGSKKKLSKTYPLHVSTSDWKRFRAVLALNGHTARFVLLRFVREYGMRAQREDLPTPGGGDAERG